MRETCSMHSNKYVGIVRYLKKINKQTNKQHNYRDDNNENDDEENDKDDYHDDNNWESDNEDFFSLLVFVKFLGSSQ